MMDNKLEQEIESLQMNPFEKTQPRKQRNFNPSPNVRLFLSFIGREATFSTIRDISEIKNSENKFVNSQ